MRNVKSKNSIRNKANYKIEYDLFGEADKTDDDKADYFLSKYMEKVDPITRYKSFFENSAKDIDHNLLDIKRYYKKLVVVEKKWSEEKYILVLDKLLSNKNNNLNIVILDRYGKTIREKKGNKNG